MDKIVNRLDDPLTEQVIGLAMKVHRVLGPGFLESVYRRSLLLELHNAGIAGRRKRSAYRFSMTASPLAISPSTSW